MTITVVFPGENLPRCQRSLCIFDEDLPHIILTKTLTIRRKILFEILIYINSLGSDLPKIIIFWDILQVFKNLQRS